MTTDRQNGILIFECDLCGETESDDEQQEFKEFWQELKEFGWRCRPAQEGGWEHACPNCKFSYRPDRDDAGR